MCIVGRCEFKKSIKVLFSDCYQANVRSERSQIHITVIFRPTEYSLKISAKNACKKKPFYSSFGLLHSDNEKKLFLSLELLFNTYFVSKKCILVKR